MKNFYYIFLSLLLVTACGDAENDSAPDTDSVNDDVVIPLSVYQKVYNVTSEIYIEDGYVYINTDGVPDHKSPYFPAGHVLYQAYDNSNPFVTNFHLNPNGISTLDLRFKIPISPKKSSSTNTTRMGPIGVSLNGVPFYNQYAGMNEPLTREINSFDQGNGHPAPFAPGQENGVDGKYHYHMEPISMTKDKGNNVILGFLLDGFPVYGPVENSNTITSSDLDNYHGHSHTTDDFPQGIYHYHVTADDPYINGSGYYGSPGTVSQ